MKKQIILVLTSLIISITAMSQEKTVKFIIKTDYGNIKGYLYNQTPQHRDNFVKLANDGWYNGSPFHRVIANFMIQGGHNADGRVDPGYTIPAEIVNGLFHKKGALAAARMGDQVNPEKASSGSQFYIVQGQVFNEPTLEMMALQSQKTFTDEQKQAYTTVGGSPHLDGEYTVFGQIADGFDVIDKIAAVQTGAASRPVKDVKMTIEILD
jgi:cyclophilin family peptidyl-prolyl cis-trans isomerase